MVRSFCKSFAARNINERTYHLCNEHHNNFILVEGRSKPVKWRGTGGGSPGEQGGRGAGEGGERENRGREAGAEIKKAIVCYLLLGIIQSKTLI